MTKRPYLKALPTVAFLAGLWCLLCLTLPYHYFAQSVAFRQVGGHWFDVTVLALVTTAKGLYLTVGLPDRITPWVHLSVTVWWVFFASLLFASSLPLSGGFAAIVCWCSFVVYMRELT